MAMHCYNIRLSLTNQLYRVQNYALRLITRRCKMEHITPVSFQLHWLSVGFRSLYKIPFHAFKVLSGTALPYLSDLIEKYILVRTLRSESSSLLGYQKAIQQYTERNPSEQYPRLWNKLPKHIKLYLLIIIKSHILLNEAPFIYTQLTAVK